MDMVSELGQITFIAKLTIKWCFAAGCLILRHGMQFYFTKVKKNPHKTMEACFRHKI